MRFDKKWAYQKNQCDVCANAENCKIKASVNEKLEFICDCFYLDENKYKTNEFYREGENCCG